MIKISVDFDKTLSKSHVQNYIERLIKEGIEVWITTSRFDDEKVKIHSPHHNNDKLWEVVKKLGIPTERVYFTNMDLKADHLNNKDFIFHLDDDSIELEFLEKTNVVGVNVLELSYNITCDKLIEYASKNLIQNKKKFFTEETLFNLPTHPLTCDRHSSKCEIYENNEGVLLDKGIYFVCPCGDYTQKKFI
jgi:hypothetical protein